MAAFVDHVKIKVKAGNGGNGCVSFHREKFVLNGGPDGGDGGNGGNVVVFADANMHTLLDFRFVGKYFAENGVDGSAGRCHGKQGEDLIIKVPVGTVFFRDSDNTVIADMHDRRADEGDLPRRPRRARKRALRHADPAGAQFRQTGR